MVPASGVPSPGARPPSRRERWRPGAPAIPLAAGAVLLSLVAVFGFLLAESQRQARTDVGERLSERARVASAVTRSVFDSIGRSTGADLTERFASRRPSRSTLDVLAARGKLEYIRILGPDGAEVARSTRAPAYGSHAPVYVRSAFGGRDALSGVIRNDGRAVIDWAIPFRIGDRAHVYIAGMSGKSVSDFLAEGLSKLPNLAGSNAYVIDEGGLVVGSANNAAAGSRVAETGLVDALTRRPAGDLGELYYTSIPMDGSAWQVVIVGDRSTLYAPVSGPRHWIPWLIFGALTLAALLILSLVGRILLGNARLARANDELKASARALRDAQSVGHIGSWEWDLKTDRMLWSDELRRIFGLGPGDAPVTFDDYLEWMSPAQAREERANLERSLVTGGTFERDIELRRPDGERRVAHVRAEVILDAAGEATRIVGVLQDVTDQHRAERAAREAEERFRRAFEDGSVGMALVGTTPDDLGRLLHVNAALCRLAGRPMDDLVGADWATIVHPDDAAEITRGLEGLLRGDARNWRAEQRAIRPDGSAVWADVNVSVIRDGDGAPVYAVAQAQDVNERKRFEGQLQYLADHDPLTGLANRRSFKADLEGAIAHVGRYGATGAVLMVDLDRFKYVNDTLGHAVGDDLLGRVGEALRSRLRETDRVARFGGDEFAVLLPHADERQAREVAHDIRTAVRDATVVVAETGVARLTASVGIALFGEGAAREADEALVNADIAMYQAKQKGRDRIETLDAGNAERTRMSTHLKWTEAIRDAIDADRFALHAQPIRNLRTGRVDRHELLIRMVSDDGDLIPPSAFLDVAEESGMVQQIDCFVIARAVRIVAGTAWGDAPGAVQVNLSGSSVTDPAVLETIRRELRESGADPTRLVFEITETAAIANIERAKAFAAALAELGCSIALDDFGAGFGSFYYLKHLPFDCLKIDGEFICKLPASRTDQVTVQAMVQIAHGLGKEVIAEFVEDRETLELLKAYGVDYAQGYHVGFPGPVEETLGLTATQA